MSDALLTPRMKVSLALDRMVATAPSLEAVEELRADMQEILDYVDVQEKNLRTMCEESLASAREITRLRRRVAEATAGAERATSELAGVLDHVTGAFNELRQLPALLSGETPRPMGVVTEVARIPERHWSA